MAAARSSAATSGSEAAMVSAEGTTIAPGRDHRAEMDVVDLAQSRQRHIDRQAVAQRIGVLAERHERRPSAVPQAAIQAPIRSAACSRTSARARSSG